MKDHIKTFSNDVTTKISLLFSRLSSPRCSTVKSRSKREKLSLKRDVELHVPSWLLALELSKITAFDVQKALTLVKTSRMRVEMFDIYHGSLTMAYKVGFLERDIASALIKPKHSRKVGSALTRSEVGSFWKK